MTTTTDKFREAAILFASLDASIGEQLLGKLPPYEAEQIRLHAAALGSVAAKEREDVLSSFQASVSSKETTPATRFAGSTPSESEGVELGESLAELLSRYDEATDAAEEDSIDNTNTSPPDEIEQGPFSFLSGADAELLIELLQNEHPQTVATILSCLSPAFAARLLKALAQPTQIDILQRMSNLQPSAPEAVEAIAAELQDWLQKHQQQKEQRERGLAAVRSILEAADEQEHAVLQMRIRKQDSVLADRLNIPTEEPPTVQEIPMAAKKVITKTETVQQAPIELQPVSTKTAPLPFPQPPVAPPVAVPFEDLAYLNSATWNQIFCMAEPELILLAFAGAEPFLVDNAVAHLPAEEANDLRHSLTTIGPTRLSDVTTARQEIVRFAQSLQRPTLLKERRVGGSASELLVGIT